MRDVRWTTPESMTELRKAYHVERYKDENNNWVSRALNPELTDEWGITRSQPWPTEFEVNFKDLVLNPDQFVDQFGKAMMAFLTTERRLQLVKQSASPSHEWQSANLLQMLYYAGKDTEKQIRNLVRGAFRKEIILDYATSLQQLLLRVGDDFSAVPGDPREARAILSKEAKLDDQGDGIRSFVGIVVALLSLKRSLFLIDEPEAFLHPPQALRIGKFLADQADNTRQLVIATHSTDVLRGILSVTQDVSIVRIDRVGDENLFTLLDVARLKELVSDPLLASARVLDGLFYLGAVVVEADSDVRFYQAASTKQREDIDLHFVNADNKQTVPRITKMYRDMGVRYAGIVDFDVLNKATDFQKQLEALSLGEKEFRELMGIQSEIARAAKDLPPSERLEEVRQKMNGLLTSVQETLGREYSSEDEATTVKQAVLRQVDSRCHEISDSTKGWKEFKWRGREALPEDLKPRFDRLWTVCAASGLFIVPIGELESMLMEYGIQPTTDKKGWITQALLLLPGLTVDDTKYPWKFLKSIHEHLFNEREGTIKNA